MSPFFHPVSGRQRQAEPDALVELQVAATGQFE